MLTQALLAGVESGINRVLSLDATALPRLAPLSGKVLAVHCSSPAISLYLLPDVDGLHLASQWHGEISCSLQAPASSLLRLALSQNKTAILHQPDVELSGDSAALMTLAAILQDLELDWEYELSRWLGPVASQLVGSHVRSRLHWASQSAGSLRQNLADYLSEEARSLVGQREAEARFAELDQLKLALDRLDARIERLVHRSTPKA